MRNTFRKEERLCSHKAIGELFANNCKIFSHPFLMRWQIVYNNEKTPAKVIIIVPKRKLRHAVDRNRTKRLIRECYRLQKHTLYSFLESHDTNINLALYYSDTRCPDFKTLYEKTEKALDKLIAELNKNRTEIEQ